jgi:Zn-dependent membrane protease YugP
MRPDVYGFFVCIFIHHFNIKKAMITFGPAMFIGIFFMLVGLIVSWRLRSRFKAYSRIPSQRGLTGAQIAEQMLRDHGIYDVRIVSVEGQLSDHYNPMNKTVNLSQEVYFGTNAAAAAVAAHECGHAVQHASAYAPLEWRSKLVPLQNVSGMILNAIMVLSIFGGAFLYEAFPIRLVLWSIVIAYGIIALFSVVTLPVEFDASKRALAWIQRSGTATHAEYEMSRKALNLAATTYVVAALGALTILLYYVMALIGANDE